jgi:ApbE superfamily uncharacterized protein (UPF0280 family)
MSKRTDMETILRVTTRAAIRKGSFPPVAVAGALAQIAVETLTRAGYTCEEINLWAEEQVSNLKGTTGGLNS